MVIVVAFVFGVVASVVKGNGPGWRDGVGNLSAPWVIVPLLAAAAQPGRRIWVGALLGALATMSALVGFYLANAFVLDLGAHSLLHDLSLTLNPNTIYFRAGLLSGPLMGALGMWAARRGRRFVGAIAAVVLIFEPVATYAFSNASNGWWAAGGGAWDGVYAVESVVGLAIAAVLWRARTPAAR